MTLPFIALLDLVLLTRLVLSSDAPLTARRAVPLIVVQAAGPLLLLKLTFATGGLALALAALGCGLWWADRRLPGREPGPATKPALGKERAQPPGDRHLVRLLFLAADGVALAVLLAPWSGAAFWPWVAEAARAVPGYVLAPLLIPETALRAGIVLMGVLLVLNEANLVVRAVLHTAGVEPSPAAAADAGAPRRRTTCSRKPREAMLASATPRARRAGCAAWAAVGPSNGRRRRPAVGRGPDHRHPRAPADPGRHTVGPVLGHRVHHRRQGLCPLQGAGAARFCRIRAGGDPALGADGGVGGGARALSSSPRRQPRVWSAKACLRLGVPLALGRKRC